MNEKDAVDFWERHKIMGARSGVYVTWSGIGDADGEESYGVEFEASKISGKVLSELLTEVVDNHWEFDVAVNHGVPYLIVR